MPTIEINLKDLNSLIGRDLSVEELEEVLSYLKGEVDDVIKLHEDKDTTEIILRVEIKDSNRPDLWSVEGLAREIRGYLGIETGIPSYEISDSEKEVIVDASVKEIRPYIGVAIVRDVNLGESGLSSLIQLQDKVMQTFGRNRKKVAIGTHNLDLVRFPIKYTAVDPDSVKFKPLYNEGEEMTLREILEKNEKGRKYAHLLEGYDKYPILVDASGEVISFPPIINSAKIGKLSPETKNILIDVTGTSLEDVLVALNVIVTALAERGGKIERVAIKYPDGRVIKTPDLKIEEVEVPLEKILKGLGVDLKEEELIDMLRSRRMDAEVRDGKLIVRYLNYRKDIFTWQDVLEEIAMAYGYDKLVGEVNLKFTKGKIHSLTEFESILKDILVSMGFVELHTPVLMSKSFVSKFSKDYIELENPVSSEYNVIRPSLLPTLMKAFQHNKKAPLPQKIFEIGIYARKKDDRYEEGLSLGIGITDNEISVTEIQRVLNSLFNNLGLSYEIEQVDRDGFIPGRYAKVKVNGEEIGYFGEIHPSLLEELEVYNPVVVAELDVQKLFELLQK